ncbi:MAG: Crp/Fnr family transcriptional regulator, partial [Candidatus Methylomirabilales bacterium]
LFRGANPDDLVALAAITESKDFLPGDFVYHTGDPADAMFYIEMGTVEIVNPRTQKVFATLGTGQSIGEVAFFDSGKRAAVAIARERTRVLRIPFNKLSPLFTERPGLALVVYRNASAFLAKHLRQLALEINHRYL